MSLIQRCKAAYRAFKEASWYSAQVDLDEQNYRRLGDTNRDLTPFAFDQSLKIAYYLYETNSMPNA